MYIAPFNWSTADAFWHGYMASVDGDPFEQFRPRGLAFVGAPGSNTSVIYELKRQHDVETDADYRRMSREQATEIASLVCGMVEAFVTAHQ